MDLLNLKNTIQNVSYLRARDPSLVAFSLAADVVRANLIPELGATAIEAAPTEPKENSNIRVYLRIKNVEEPEFDELYEISENTLTTKVPPGSQCALRNFKDGDSLKKMYTFSRIFPAETTQADIFNNIVKKKILDFINGENSTLLTYGVSGSGKTFTAIGTDKEPGVVPRSLEYLFRTLPQLSQKPVAKPLPAGNVSILNESECRREKQARNNLLNAASLFTDRAQHVRTYTAMQQRLSNEPVGLLDLDPDVSVAVWVSFAEIYNEQVYDLLAAAPPRGKPRQRLRLGTSANGTTYIKNLTHISVSSGLDAFQVLQYGTHNLNYAKTSLNTHSSRSHSIFTIKLVQFSAANGDTYVSSFNFCDLAGSERSKKTLNVGDRLKESNNINSSLLVLGRCISAVREAQKVHDSRLIVPFRESKLTQLFQRALAGHEDIAMIVNMSPKKEFFDETQHVLTFSAVAKDIAVERRPAENLFLKKNTRFSRMVESRSALSPTTCEEYEESIEELRNVVELLRDELEQQRNEFEVNEQMNRNRLVEGYEKIIKDMEKDAERRVRNAEIYTKQCYEQKIKATKAKYERLLQEESEKNTVIQLDSSDDDDEKEQLKNENDNLEAKLKEFQAIINMQSVEKRNKDEENRELKDRIIALKEQTTKLESDLNDAVNEYCRLKAMYEEKLDENLVLLSKNDSLEKEVETLKKNNITATHLWSDEDETEESKENRDLLNLPSMQLQ